MTILHFNLALCLMTLLTQRGITQTTIGNNENDEMTKYGFFEGMIRHLFKMGKDNIDQNTASWETFINNYNKTVSGILHSNSDLQEELSKLQKDVRDLMALSNSTDLIFIKALALARLTSAISGDALQIFTSLSTIVTDFTTGIRTAVLLLLGDLGRNFDNLEAMVKYPPTAVYLKIMQVYRAVITQLTGVVTAVNRDVSHLAGGIITANINIARNVSGAINKSLRAAAGTMVSALQLTLQGVGRVVMDVAAVPRWTATALGSVISRLDDVVQSAVGVIASVADIATAPARAFVSRLRELRKSVMFGLGAAVGSAVKAVVGVPIGIIRG